MGKISTRLKLDVVRIWDVKLKELLKESNQAIRVFAHIKLKGQKEIEEAIVDTGAHTTVIPYDIWRCAEFEILGNYVMRGLISRKECEIPVKIGRVKIKIVDSINESLEKEVIAYLAETNEIPLILGFRNLLEDFKLVLNIKANEAFLEEHS